MIVCYYTAIFLIVHKYIFLSNGKQLKMATIKSAPTFKKNFYESTAWATNELIAGIDEVGRGCLAGPVVASAVILKPHKTHNLLKDSKL